MLRRGLRKLANASTYVTRQCSCLRLTVIAIGIVFATFHLLHAPATVGTCMSSSSVFSGHSSKPLVVEATFTDSYGRPSPFFDITVTNLGTKEILYRLDARDGGVVQSASPLSMLLNEAHEDDLCWEKHVDKIDTASLSHPVHIEMTISQYTERPEGHIQHRSEPRSFPEGAIAIDTVIASGEIRRKLPTFYSAQPFKKFATTGRYALTVRTEPGGLVSNLRAGVGSLHQHSLTCSCTAPGEAQLPQGASPVPPLKAGSPPYLFIGILSSRHKAEHRMGLRNGWLKHGLVISGQVKYTFIVGQGAFDIDPEAQYGDIQEVPFPEDYYSIANKSVQVFVRGDEEKAAWTMKVDDDTFVHISRLIELLHKIPKGLFYVGNIECYGEPEREGIWGHTKEQYPADTYPPFAHGSGYLMSGSLVRHIAQQHQGGHLMPIALEDVGAGIWVQEAKARHGLLVNIISDARFLYMRMCEEDAIVIHYVDPAVQHCIWEAQTRLPWGPKLCSCYVHDYRG